MVVFRAFFTERISRSQTPLKWGACGGLKRKWIFLVASTDWRMGERLLKASCNSLFPPLKFVPRRHKISFGVPLREVKHWRAMRKESVSMLLRRSRCTHCVVRHLNIIPHVFASQPSLGWLVSLSTFDMKHSYPDVCVPLLVLSRSKTFDVFQWRVFLNQCDVVFHHSHEWSVLSHCEQDQARLDGLTQIPADSFASIDLQHGWVQWYCTTLGINRVSGCVVKVVSVIGGSLCPHQNCPSVLVGVFSVMLSGSQQQKDFHWSGWREIGQFHPVPGKFWNYWDLEH